MQQKLTCQLQQQSLNYQNKLNQFDLDKQQVIDQQSYEIKSLKNQKKTFESQLNDLETCIRQQVETFQKKLSDADSNLIKKMAEKD